MKKVAIVNDPTQIIFIRKINEYLQDPDITIISINYSTVKSSGVSTWDYMHSCLIYYEKKQINGNQTKSKKEEFIKLMEQALEKLLEE